ncbi:MAG: glycolate oxidase subunit GlcF [Pseudomonadales bacterium]
MQTSLPEAYAATPEGRRAEAILRSCVHCGFCNATCPTYQLLGDELDGPRGRIYLIKDMLETQRVDPVAVRHLDRCLTCRACEITCPSGVAYGELAEIGRNYLEREQARAVRGHRSWFERLQRRWLLSVVPRRRVFARWAALGRLAGPFLPARLRAQLPRRRKCPESVGEIADPVRTVLLLDGCAQSVSTPEVNDALVRLLAVLRVRVIRVPDEGCCGALALHLGEEAQAHATMTASLGALTPHLGEVDAVISTASGCGVTLKDYGRLLAGNAERSAGASVLADKVVDVGEFLDALDVDWKKAIDVDRVAVHVPCTLQHGQRCGSLPAALLERAGYTVVPVRDAHLCCGSAGSYAILQPELSQTLGTNKVAALSIAEPELIATANVGCQVHLGALAPLPVKHWVELLTVADH